MAWSNSTGDWFNHDMDSWDGNVQHDGKRLKVRNRVGELHTNDFRVEIAERAHPLDPHNALKINGDVVLDYYGEDNQDHLAGSITVEPAGLFINSRGAGEGSVGGDPDVHIGWHGNEQHPGNYVFIDGKEIGIGPGQSPQTGFAVTMKSPIKMPGGTELNADVQVEGTVEARKVDALSFADDKVLGLGRATATTVEVGHPGTTEHPELGETRIKGRLKAEQDTDLQGTVLIRGNLTAQSPVELRNNTTVLGNLVVSDSASATNVNVSNAVSATNVNVSNTVTARNLAAQAVVSATDVNATGAVTGTRIAAGSAAILMDEQCRALVPTLIRTERDEPALTVEHLHGDRQAALHVVNESTFEEATGGYFRASLAIVAEGQVRITGRALLNGETVHSSPVLM